MTDVLVTLPISRGGLSHLNEKVLATQNLDTIAYWEFKRIPKSVNIGDRLYVLCEGFVRGYFHIESIDTSLVVITDWNELKPIKEMLGFRGYKYVWRGAY